jgi:hypothetical protein
LLFYLFFFIYLFFLLIKVVLVIMDHRRSWEGQRAISPLSLSFCTEHRNTEEKQEGGRDSMLARVLEGDRVQ